VNVSLGVAGRRVRVQVPRTESPRSPTDSYEITEYAHEIPISVGEERHDAIVKVVQAEQRRIRRAAAKQYKQTWFDDGQGDKAISFLRGQLARARTSVMVADAYFGARQVLQFLQAVPPTQIDFTILTSRLAFESEHAEAIDAPQDDVRDQAENSTSRAPHHGQPRALMAPSLLVELGPEAIRQPRRPVLVRYVTPGAWSAGTPAVASVVALPRSTRVSFTNPPAILAE
jgi:hypothetical protein